MDASSSPPPPTQTDVQQATPKALHAADSTTAKSAKQTFAGLLQQLAAVAADAKSPVELATAFCLQLKTFFGADGAYCWRLRDDRLQCVGADGEFAYYFQHADVPQSESPAALLAMRNRKPLLSGAAQPDSPRRLSETFTSKSLMVVPLLTAAEATGALAIASVQQENAFDQEKLQQAAVAASLLTGCLEILLSRKSKDEETEHARALMQCAARLPGILSSEKARQELAVQAATLLHAELAVLLERLDGSWQPTVVHQTKQTGTPAVDGYALDAFARSAASRLQEQDVLQVELAAQKLGIARVESGSALVSRIKLRNEDALLLVYCGSAHNFSDGEIALLREVSALGALTLQNSEILSRSDAQARELQQLLEVANDVASPGTTQGFLERFAIRTTAFLNFRRSFIALLSAEGACNVLYIADPEKQDPVFFEMPTAMRDRFLQRNEVYWSNEVTRRELDNEFIRRLEVKQILMAPLRRSDGRVMGALGVLDRADGGSITEEDAQRAQVLASQVSVVLESRQNLFAADEQRKRAESLIALAFDIGSSVRVPDLVRVLATRATEMLGGSAVAVALARGLNLEIVYLEPAVREANVLRRLNAVLTEFVSRAGTDAIRSGPGSEMVGEFLANALGWRDVTLARLHGGEGDLIGMLCIANRGLTMSADDSSTLQALIAHSSVALENSRLFTRMAQSNSQWTEIFDSISDFIVVHDQDYRVLRVNRTMADFMGVPPAELIGVNMRALMALAQETTLSSCAFCRSGAEADDEFVHPVLERTYLVSTSKVQGALDEGQQTIHVLKDISDRREAERRYRELFDNIQEGLFFSTPEGRFVEANDAMVRMLGYESREDLFQVDIANQLYLQPDTRQENIEVLNRDGVLRNSELKLRRKDGSIIYTLENSFVVRDAQGKVVQYRGVMLDITELKNFQAQLERQRDFTSRILNTTQSLILVVDTAGLISFSNRHRAEAGGYREGALVGSRLAEMVAPEQRDKLREAFAGTLQGRAVDNLELTFLLPGARQGKYSLNFSPMRDDQGQVDSIVVVMTDITQESIFKQKLMHTEKMAAVGQLVSGVAHEVNNPLTAILGFSELLAAASDMPETAKADLGIIVQEAQRTKQIVQNLLSFARQTPPQREGLAINELLRRTLQLRAYDFNNKGIEIVQDLQEPAPELVGDAQQLQQVFLNIINNAYDAVLEVEQRRIEVTSRFHDGQAEVEFRDTGPGIQAVERVFDPFYTTKDVGKGTGLGLSICYGIVHEHGGEIVVANREGGGAVITVRLPLSGERPAADEGNTP